MAPTATLGWCILAAAMRVAATPNGGLLGPDLMTQNRPGLFQGPSAPFKQAATRTSGIARLSNFGLRQSRDGQGSKLALARAELGPIPDPKMWPSTHKLGFKPRREHSADDVADKISILGKKVDAIGEAKNDSESGETPATIRQLIYELDHAQTMLRRDEQEIRQANSEDALKKSVAKASETWYHVQDIQSSAVYRRMSQHLGLESPIHG